jgi:hypothetical protein
VGSNTNNISQAKNIFKPCQCNAFMSMQTRVLESSLLTQRKGQQMDSFLEELFFKTLYLRNGNRKIKRNVIFVG